MNVPATYSPMRIPAARHGAVVEWGYTRKMFQSAFDSQGTADRGIYNVLPIPLLNSAHISTEIHTARPSGGCAVLCLQFPELPERPNGRIHRFSRYGNDQMERFTVSHNVGTTGWTDSPLLTMWERPDGRIHRFSQCGNDRMERFDPCAARATDNS